MALILQKNKIKIIKSISNIVYYLCIFKMNRSETFNGKIYYFIEYIDLLKTKFQQC